MSNANPSRLGQDNGAGATDALFLKISTPEVLAAYLRETAFRPRHRVRQIAHGKSAQFPVTGQASAFYHTPGAEILGNQFLNSERVITVDDLLISPIFVANIDELKNHFEERGEMNKQIGEGLARRYDQNVGYMGIQAARAGSVITGLPGGTTVNDPDFDTDGVKLFTGIYNAGVTLDEKDVSRSDRYAYLRPLQHALVVQSEKPIDRDLSPDNGSLAQGVVKRINDIVLVKTNNLRDLDERTNTTLNSKYRADYSPTQVLIMNRDAVGTVQLQDITMEMDYDIRRQGTLMVGKYLVGHGVLRPEAAVELRTGNPLP